MTAQAKVDRLHALSIDVEDYYQVTAFERFIARRDWPTYPSRVEQNTRRLLEILARHDVRATFYVLGWVAEHFPGLVAEIAGAGHELGSHSYWHRLVYELSPDEFREDLRRSCRAIEDAAGVAVRLYRAPSFSITQRSLWALDILAEEGIEIDSSIFAVRHDRYGIPNAPRWLHRRETAASAIWEFPVTTWRVAGMNLPLAGGGYFRLYPLAATLRCLEHEAQRSGQPLMFYIHPWELDPGQPRLNGASLTSRWRHYVNLAATESKLVALLKHFRFTTVGQVVSQADSSIPTKACLTG